jgi:hypothetical protein
VITAYFPVYSISRALRREEKMAISHPKMNIGIYEADVRATLARLSDADRDRHGCQRDGRIHQNGKAIVRIQRFDRILHGQV